MHRKGIGAWGDFGPRTAVSSSSYPPEGFGNGIDGKAEILKAFRAPAADSDTAIVEYRPRATLVGGTVYTNSNIAVFRFENGLISAYHDYIDPRRFEVVVNTLPKN